MMSNAKYLSSNPCVFLEEDFKTFSFGCHGHQSSAWNDFLSTLKEDHAMMITKMF